MNAGQDLLDALSQRPFILIEPGDSLALPSVLLVRVLAELHVAADRHEVNQILGQQIEPFAKHPLIQQIGFHIQEILDLLLQREPGQATNRFVYRRAHSAAWRIASASPSREAQSS